MDDFYRENILDHYKNPRNAGHLEHPSATAEGVTNDRRSPMTQRVEEVADTVGVRLE